MSRLALALAALVYGQSFYYKLGNTIQSYLDYSHEITYGSVPDAKYASMFSEPPSDR